MATQAQLEEQRFFDLFDSYWYAHQLFSKTENPPAQIEKSKESITEASQPLDFSAIPTINVRSYSDQLFMTSKQHSFISDSPNSIPDTQTPKLQTILSGMEVKEMEDQKVNPPVKVRNRASRRGRKRYSKSKSLSQLEFEEVQGFMDLGFVFSESDKDSSLVSIIPGLQRLGKHEKEEMEGCVPASRPYLSEAWDDLEKIRKEEAATMIRIPALGNEVEVKDQLRFWAHSVASVVR